LQSRNDREHFPLATLCNEIRRALNIQLGVGGKQPEPCIFGLEEFRKTFCQIIKFQKSVRMLSLRIIRSRG
jgi:hypothetical protein